MAKDPLILVPPITKKRIAALNRNAAKAIARNRSARRSKAKIDARIKKLRAQGLSKRMATARALGVGGGGQ